MRLKPHSVPQEFFPPFTFWEPESWVYPVVLNVPHAGALYPPAFVDETCLDVRELRQAEDAFVDELFEKVSKTGIPLLNARFPRAYLDLNRDMYELDPKLYEETLPLHYKTRSTRVLNGLGVVPRMVGKGISIYDKKRRLLADWDKIECLYKPYHKFLRECMHRAQALFDTVILIDCHSMPSQAAASHFKNSTMDIVLGNRYGTSCSTKIITTFAEAFIQKGYRVALNDPYAGAYITEHYGVPSQNRHALQIEINRMLYMDEEKIEKNAEKITLLQETLRDVFLNAMTVLWSRDSFT